jgi:histidine triad (HIT) family protein
VPDCLFCGIASGEVPATIVLESESTLAFRDINPQAPIHVLVIPKAHHRTLAELAEQADLLAELVKQVHKVAESEGIADDGYRVVFNTGDHAGQSVHHVHAHVLGGRALSWTPG